MLLITVVTTILVHVLTVHMMKKYMEYKQNETKPQVSIHFDYLAYHVKRATTQLHLHVILILNYNQNEIPLS